MRLAARAAFVWVGMRLAVFMVLLFLGLPGIPLHPLAALGVVAATAAAVALDARRRETLFYANLGVPTAWPWIVGAAVAGVLEVAVAVGMAASGGAG